MLSDVGAYTRIAAGLVRLVHRPCTVERAKSLVRAHLARREQLFLKMVLRGIWQNPSSPYRRLMEWASWSYDSLEESVQHRGIEGTLVALRDAGVYVGQEEIKGRKPIQRDGLVIECPTDEVFTNISVVPTFGLRTGGTRSPGMFVPASIDYLTDQRAPAWCLSLAALGAESWPTIVWLNTDAGFLWWLALTHMGRPPLRWFSTTNVSGMAASRRREAMIRLGQVIGLTRGLRVPDVEQVPLSEASAVFDAVVGARARYGGCAVVTTPSVATRFAGLADRQGIDLEGVAFLVGGEPLTPGKWTEITRSKARVGTRYNLTEAGAVGGACAHPDDPDDVHFLADSFALIPHRRTLPNGDEVDAFMLTTLLPSTPGISLNVETDDFGKISTRRCGCLWDELGLHTHLSNIRSFSKLTGEGVTVLGTDCVRALEEVLPGEFGGRSVDYQLLEEEDDQHLTRLYLVISPSVGPVDEARVVARFVEAAGAGKVTRWLQAGTIRVARREPVPTRGGKLLAFHTLALTLPGRKDMDAPKPSAEGSRIS